MYWFIFYIYFFSEFRIRGLPLDGYDDVQEKHSPDSACSVDYSSSRLSSPDHPNEGQ